MKLTPEEVKERIVTNFPKLGTEYAGIAEDAIAIKTLGFDQDDMDVYNWGRSVGWDHQKSVDYTIRVSPNFNNRPAKSGYQSVGDQIGQGYRKKKGGSGWWGR